jgi:hypothetical protein
VAGNIHFIVFCCVRRAGELLTLLRSAVLDMTETFNFAVFFFVRRDRILSSVGHEDTEYVFT